MSFADPRYSAAGADGACARDGAGHFPTRLPVVASSALPVGTVAALLPGGMTCVPDPPERMEDPSDEPSSGFDSKQALPPRHADPHREASPEGGGRGDGRGCSAPRRFSSWRFLGLRVLLVGWASSPRREQLFLRLS